LRWNQLAIALARKVSAAPVLIANAPHVNVAQAVLVQVTANHAELTVNAEQTANVVLAANALLVLQ
jgi:hypothetical protein